MKKFAKIIALVAICLLTSCVWLGCSDNDIPETVQEMSITQSAENTESEYFFNEVPSEGNEIEEYRKEYKNRIETNTLKREDEIEFLENNGYFIYTGGGYFQLSYYEESVGWTKTYFDPIVYRSDNGFEVWAIDGHGELCSITIEDRGVYAFDEEMRMYLKDTMVCHDEEFYGPIHYTAKEGEEIIKSDKYRVISYEHATGLVKEWKYGELIGQVKVPANSVYVGNSYFAGYLFRDSTDVWATQSIREDYESDNWMWVSNIIAHNVEFVITAEYCVGHDCLPLFLMTDGTLKTYSLYHVEYDTPIDDESHLIDVQNEGDMM